LSGLPVFEHYLKRLSQRGWGQFRFQTVDARSGAAEIRLENSLFVLAATASGTSSRTATQCYMFSGWFAGAMDWVLETSGAHVKTHSSEVHCGGEGHSHCLFRVRPQN
jgi:predicted hydrocarbon binding protein